MKRKDPQKVVEFLRAEGWEQKDAKIPGRHSWTSQKLWMPPFGQGYDFFSDFGLVFGGSYSYNAPAFKWVKVTKKIFRNNQAYTEWSNRVGTEIAEVEQRLGKLRKKLQKKYADKHKLKGRQRKYNYKYEETDEYRALEKQRDELANGRPDIVLHSHKVYYLLYYVDIDEVMNKGKNSALLETIIFNLEKLQ